MIPTEITKLLCKISKEKGNEELKPWVKPCEKHLYWSAPSTPDGNGKFIWAKFKSYLSHIVNQHTNLDDPLFNKCAHGDIPHRTWINPGRCNLYYICLLSSIFHFNCPRQKTEHNFASNCVQHILRFC